jgi:hypothetical protein
MRQWYFTESKGVSQSSGGGGEKTKIQIFKNRVESHKRPAVLVNEPEQRPVADRVVAIAQHNIQIPAYFAPNTVGGEMAVSIGK